MEIPSKHVRDAVDAFASLPGIGQRTALRLAMHLLNRPKDEVAAFSETFIRLAEETMFCKRCHNLSETEICSICSNAKRNQQVVCVVEDLRDLIAIENTRQFAGVYHVLGGNISPMDGIGPGDLTIDDLVRRVQEEDITEIILALSTTMEGDTTNFYLYRKLKDSGVNISTIARGVAIGDELEYTDEVTLGRSILNRTPYETTVSK